MFTGLVDIATLSNLTQDQNGYQLSVVAPSLAGLCKKGDSVAIDGICLTVVEQRDDQLLFYVSPETIQRTALLNYKNGQSVNVELPLRPTDRLGGHYVLGHVDCTGSVKTIQATATSWFFTIEIPEPFIKYVVYKGSIAVNGISLTVNQIRDCEIELCIIPVTMEKTNLSFLQTGSLVNIEVDILAKYTANLLPNHG
jgi:riboflavin synthase